LARHYQETRNQIPNTHLPQGGQLPGTHPVGQMVVRDDEVVWRLSRQGDESAAHNARVMKSRYKSIPVTGDLFASGPPTLEDIRQSHQRGNCYMSTAIAAVLIRDGGWKKIEQIMQDNGDTVTVRLKGADVTVDKSQIVTKGNDGIFNIGKPWVHILEKAVTAYLLKSEDAPADTADEGFVKDAMDVLSNTLGGPDESAADLDVVRGHLDRGANMKADRWRGNWPETIKSSLERGQVVTLSTDAKMTDNQALMYRIVPQHEYPIVGTAVRNGEKGYLVMDVHGISAGWDGHQLGSFPQVTVNNGAEMNLQTARRGSGPLFFVSENEMDMFNALWHEPQRELGADRNRIRV
jgi:hypothetical protein